MPIPEIHRSPLTPEQMKETQELQKQSALASLWQAVMGIFRRQPLHSGSEIRDLEAPQEPRRNWF